MSFKFRDEIYRKGDLVEITGEESEETLFYAVVVDGRDYGSFGKADSLTYARYKEYEAKNHDLTIVDYWPLRTGKVRKLSEDEISELRLIRSK